MEATARMKDGGDCDLLSRLAACPEFGMSEAELEALLEPCNYTGRCKQQVEAFLSSILPVLNDDDSSLVFLRNISPTHYSRK